MHDEREHAIGELVVGWLTRAEADLAVARLTDLEATHLTPVALIATQKSSCATKRVEGVQRQMAVLEKCREVSGSCGEQ